MATLTWLASRSTLRNCLRWVCRCAFCQFSWTPFYWPVLLMYCLMSYEHIFQNINIKWTNLKINTCSLLLYYSHHIVAIKLVIDYSVLFSIVQFDREHFSEVFVDLKWFESKVGNKYLNEAAGLAAEEAVSKNGRKSKVSKTRRDLQTWSSFLHWLLLTWDNRLKE